MIAAAALALLLVQGPVQTPAPAPPAADAPTPVSPLIVPAPAQPDPEKIAADLAQVYDQACGARIYGTYADACNALASQLNKAQAAARKEAARKAKLAKSVPAAAAH